MSIRPGTIVQVSRRRQTIWGVENDSALVRVTHVMCALREGRPGQFFLWKLVSAVIGNWDHEGSIWLYDVPGAGDLQGVRYLREASPLTKD